MSDIRRMQLGQVVDYVIAYNDRQKRAEDQSERAAKAKDEPKRRKATQADINLFFG